MKRHADPTGASRGRDSGGRQLWPQWSLDAENGSVGGLETEVTAERVGKAHVVFADGFGPRSARSSKVGAAAA